MKGAACYKLYDAAARCYDENTRVVCVCVVAPQITKHTQQCTDTWHCCVAGQGKGLGSTSQGEEAVYCTVCKKVSEAIT